MPDKSAPSRRKGSTGAAVLIIDMVKDFVDPQGKVYYPGIEKTVPAVQRIIEVAREVGALVIWVIDYHRPGKPDWELEWVQDHCTQRTSGVEIVPPFEPCQEDYVIYKRRYSAFVGTDLDLILRENGVELLFLTGAKTNVCIRATAQDAFVRNYRVTVPRECVSSNRDDLHQANLEDIDRYLGQVVSLEEAIARLRDSSI